jgi:hypothetical protein
MKNEFLFSRQNFVLGFFLNLFHFPAKFYSWIFLDKRVVTFNLFKDWLNHYVHYFQNLHISNYQPYIIKFAFLLLIFPINYPIQLFIFQLLIIYINY